MKCFLFFHNWQEEPTFRFNNLSLSPHRKDFFCHKVTKSLSFTKSIALINNTLCASVSSVPPWFSFSILFGVDSSL